MKKTDLSQYDTATVPNGAPYRIAVVAAEWNSDITDPMYTAAIDTLRTHGVLPDNILTLRVPGTYELTTAADLILRQRPDTDAVICIGCVIQGETRHFEFICQAVSQGLTNVSLKHEKPVIFSVLTCDTLQQAKERSGGQHGNKGIEGAVTALRMAHLHRTLA